MSRPRRPARPGRRGRLVAALIATLITALAAPLAPGPAPAAGRTAPPDGPEPVPARVIIDALEPTVPRPGGELRVTGRVQNAGETPLRDASVRLLLSTLPVLSRSQLEAFATGRAEPPERPLDATHVVLPDVAPGRTAGFVVRVALDRLGLGGFGVYPLAVEARGSTGVGFGRLALTRTFLPWVPDPPRVQPTRLAWLWPLADRPRRDGGVFVDDELAGALGPGGRLAGLLAAARGRRVAWVVDPMLLDDAAAMSDGYAVAGSRGGTDPGRGEPAARTFLDQLSAEVAGDEVVALPYGDPDVVAARRGGLGPSVTAALRRGREVAEDVLGRPVSTGTAVPPGGWLDAPTAALLGGSGADAVVLAAGARPLAEDLSFTPTGRTTVPLESGAALDGVLVDQRLSDVVAADTARAGEAVLARQRFLAETAMITAERPADGRMVAVAPPTRWAPAGATAARLLAVTESAPWIRPVRLGDLVAAPEPDVARRPLTYPAEAAAAELSVGHVAAVRQVGRTIRTLDELRGDSGRTGDERVAAELLSAGLRDDRALRRALLDRARRRLAAALGGVRVLPTSVQLSSREQSFPVTVVNDLEHEVTVRVVLSTDSPRLSVGATRPVTVAAGGKRQVLVPARAVANGVVTVRAGLQTSAGTAFGTPAQIRVRVAQIGLAALLVTAGAAVLLFAAAGRNIVRRLRRRPPSRGRHVG